MLLPNFNFGRQLLTLSSRERKKSSSFPTEKAAVEETAGEGIIPFENKKEEEKGRQDTLHVRCVWS